jgi:hypothetical protein
LVGAAVFARISITIGVIIGALFPGCGGKSPAGGGSLFSADLSRSLGPDGRLSFRIPGCAAAAAPFVLFRLKRSGFSDCRATATKEGLLVEARR